MSELSVPSDTDPVFGGLTDPQREAVGHVEGPLLVLAAAGSGKTRVITRRIAHLVLRVGIAPWNVLAITFTNKAAGEMRERVGGLVSERQANAVTVSTFHSLCARLLREHAERLGLPRTYSIYDTADQTQAMKRTLKAMHISTTNFPPGRVLSTISQAKNELLSPEAYANQAADFYSRSVSEIYKKYQATLNKNNALDFDDLLLRTVTLLKDHPDVLAVLRDRYQYLLIDEYQDTNHAQFTIANALAAQHGNICATGDPDQSIYGWRGADIRNILEFEQHYPKATTVRLEQNYRSTKTILAVADRLISHNKQRKHKSLWTENDQGDPIQAVTANDERHEAQWVLDWFTRLRNEQGVPWGDMAVFYRVNSLSRVMEDALRTASVPYQIARGTSFYERKEIKDAIAYLRVIANPADEVNLLRVVNTPARGISPSTVRALTAYSVAHGTPLIEAMEQAMHVTSLNGRAVGAVGKFVAQLHRWRCQAGLTESDAPGGAPPAAADAADEAPSLRRFVEAVLRESGLETLYRNDKTDPDQERLMNLGELVSAAQQFEEVYDDQQQATGAPAVGVASRLEGYLEQVSLVSDLDAIDAEHGAVSLMTLHAAKGLEFPVVAMVGVEDGLLPHREANTDNKKLEEERRLCFVGITRAKQRLAMTHTCFRTVFGQLLPAIPSRFLSEMPEDYMDTLDLTGHGVAAGGGGDRRYVSLGENGDEAESDGLSPGALVRHPQFGLGRIVTVTRSGSQPRARVEFNTAGVKTLVLKYAHLELVEA